jgi:hypothetical protein
MDYDDEGEEDRPDVGMVASAASGRGGEREADRLTMCVE